MGVPGGQVVSRQVVIHTATVRVQLGGYRGSEWMVGRGKKRGGGVKKTEQLRIRSRYKICCAGGEDRAESL